MAVLKKRNIMDKTGNQINVIYPYRTKHGWAFDDRDVDLQREPFVAGIPEIIDSIVGDRRDFTALISAEPIPDYSGHLVKNKKSKTVGWYELQGTGRMGWLCPATLRYFKDYPDDIYFKIE